MQDHQVKVTVELESQPFEDAKQKAARQIAKRTRIPGFRPGKAPYSVVVRSVGEGAIVQEAMDLLLDIIYPQMLDEAQIRPYGPGSLTNIISLDPPTLEFTVPLEPQVGLPDYATIRFPYEFSEPNQADVDQIVEDLRDRYATFEPADRPAQDGDQVSLHISAERKHVEEGQSLAIINDRETALTVNSEDADTQHEWPFSGFSRKLVGLSAGNEISFEYTYPEDSYLENLRGTEAVFRIKVDAVKQRALPELNDEFAQNLGEYENLEKLREEILRGITEQRKNDYDRDFQNKIIDEILKDAMIQYPPQMFERELDAFQRQLEDRLAQQGLDMKTYLATRQLDAEGLRKELMPSAEQRLRRSLVLLEVARQEKIEVNEQEVQNQAITTLNQIHQYYKPDEAKKILTQDFIQNIISNITSDLLVQNTLNHLASIAKGEAAEAEQASDSEKSTPQTETKSVAVEAAIDENIPPTEVINQADETPKAKPTKKRKSKKESE
jgi:trigger factor